MLRLESLYHTHTYTRGICVCAKESYTVLESTKLTRGQWYKEILMSFTSVTEITIIDVGEIT